MNYKLIKYFITICYHIFEKEGHCTKPSVRLGWMRKSGDSKRDKQKLHKGNSLVEIAFNGGSVHQMTILTLTRLNLKRLKRNDV